MRDLTDLRNWSIALATMGLALMARRRNRMRRRRLRPQVTPLRLIHPDELADTTPTWRRAG